MSRALEMIREIYDQLPTVDCKGLCWNSCGPIDMSNAERERLVELGMEIPTFTAERAAAWANDEPLYCPALSFSARDGQIGCSVYQDRPLICRVWGLSEGDMACPHGCEVSRRMPPEEVFALIVKVMDIGGHPLAGDDTPARLQEFMNDPELAPLIQQVIAGDRTVLPEIENIMRERAVR